MFEEGIMRTVWRVALLTAALISGVPLQASSPADEPQVLRYETRTVEGWTLKIREELLQEHPQETAEAVELLRGQLQEIRQRVPAGAVKCLQTVKLYFSPEYKGEGARAEYHPGEGWLRDHGRDVSMVRSVEFSNILIFREETERMPNFALHELAHALHHQFLRLGYGNPELAEAYERVRRDGRYERVERRFGGGRAVSKERHYGMSNPQEYFAESSEAWFSENDFFPFNREQLKQHDGEMCELLERLWNQAGTENSPTN
jgi:dipeptidyl-peptidase-4